MEKESAQVLEKTAQSVVVESTPLPKEPRPIKRKHETEDNSPSAEAVLKRKMTEVSPRPLSRLKTSGYRDSNFRKLERATLTREKKSSLEPITEQDLKPQRVKIKPSLRTDKRGK